MSAYPPLLQASHDEGSRAALHILLLAICMWEIMYHIFRKCLRAWLAKYPQLIFHHGNAPESNIIMTNVSNIHPDSSGNNGSSNHSLTEASQVISRRGPSYLVSLVHSIFATARGIVHLSDLRSVSRLEKLVNPPTHTIGYVITSRHAGLKVGTTNVIFLSFLLYDLIHILLQYPKLGGIDTILHHIMFAICSIINGTYGIMVFPFGWLVVGELSTIFLNGRWFLLKTGRENSPAMRIVNALFAASFYLTRNVVYTIGMIHLFYWSWEELKVIPEVTGAPMSFLGLTGGCIIVGWVLNMVWGVKILRIAVGNREDKRDNKKL